LIVARGKWVPRSNSQNVRLAFSSVIKAHSGIEAEKIHVSGSAGAETYDPILASAGCHITVSVQDHVDFFGQVVVVGEIGSSRCKLHHEQFCYNYAAIKLVIGAFSVSKEKPVLRGRRMTGVRLQFNLIGISNLQLGRVG